jgi:hypothetical protein
LNIKNLQIRTVKQFSIPVSHSSVIENCFTVQVLSPTSDSRSDF